MSNRFPVVSSHRRDGTSYRARPLKPKWPHGAHCIAAITLNFDGPSWDLTQGVRPLGARSGGHYSGRIGVRRQLDLLERHDIKGTFFIPGYDAECYPELIREIAARGHEVGAHGYLHERVLFEPEEEERRLRRTHDILGDLLGAPPKGWRSPSGQKTYTTLGVLSSLGYLYDASDKDFDAPYVLDLGDGRRMAEVPNNAFSLDDFPWVVHSRTPTSEMRDAWIAEFDHLYAERGYFMLGIHSRAPWGSGIPSRAIALEELIRHMKQHPAVRFMTVSEIAEWVMANPGEVEEVKT